MSEAYSVVIPAYNAARTLAEALDSLRRQSCPPARIVVVDDGSSDGTAALAEGWGDNVLVVRQANAGPGAATTAGLALVETPLVAGLDADDLWLPRKAERQLARLAAEPALDGVFCRARLFHHGQPVDLLAVDPQAPVQDLWTRTTMLLRTATARRIGPVEDLVARGRGEMIDWIARGRDLGARFELLEEVLALRRIIPGSLSQGRDARDRGYLLAAKAALDRKRAGQG